MKLGIFGDAGEGVTEEVRGPTFMRSDDRLVKDRTYSVGFERESGGAVVIEFDAAELEAMREKLWRADKEV